MNPICRGCPGRLLGDCATCGVAREEEEREFHEEEVCDDGE